MSEIVKHVNRAIPVLERTVLFTQADASSGDFLMVEDSLGKSAKTINIEVESGGALTVQFNLLQKVYPMRDDMSIPGSLGDRNITLGANVEATGNVGSVILASGETWSANKEFPIRNIKVVSASGNWSIFVS